MGALGFGSMAAGFNSGLDRIEQRDRQQSFDQMDEERHELSMETGRENLDWTRENRQRQTEQWENQAETQALTREAMLAMGYLDMTGDASKLVEVANREYPEMGLQDVQLPPDAEEGVITMADGTQRPAGREEILAYGTMLFQPDALIQHRQQMTQARAEHGAKMTELGVKHGEFMEGADGNMTFQPARPGAAVDSQGNPVPAAQNADAQDLTADQRNVASIASAFGVPEAEAWNMVLQSKGKARPDAISAIANTLMSEAGMTSEFRKDPEAAYKKAAEIYDSMDESAGPTGFGGMGAGQQGPQPGRTGPNRTGTGPEPGNQQTAGNTQRTPYSLEEAANQTRNALREGIPVQTARKRLAENGYTEQQIQQIISGAQ